jgi:hypothetical protein
VCVCICVHFMGCVVCVHLNDCMVRVSVCVCGCISCFRAWFTLVLVTCSVVGRLQAPRFALFVTSVNAFLHEDLAKFPTPFNKVIRTLPPPQNIQRQCAGCVNVIMLQAQYQQATSSLSLSLPTYLPTYLSLSLSLSLFLSLTHTHSTL